MILRVSNMPRKTETISINASRYSRTKEINRIGFFASSFFIINSSCKHNTTIITQEDL